ncbi:MAG: ATP-dependent Clp protease ATP-binding subunit ClpC, partial [Clostridia bacterium]|nr:ATP-dependent Clp protease ATP-binding subunit ClpC [Clostridia bacterium]
MPGRFTERAQRVLRLAEEEARNLGHVAVGTEHLLLGLVREGEGIAARALQNLGVDLERVRREVTKLVGRTAGPSPTQVSLTPRAKKVLELANDEARRQGVNYVGTEHILLGLIREGEGIAAHVLANLGVSADKVRQQVAVLLGGGAMGPFTWVLGGLGGHPAWGQAMGGMARNPAGARETTALDEFSTDLTQLAREDKLDPVVGREKEIERVIQVLSRRTKNNPVLIGEPG